MSVHPTLHFLPSLFITRALLPLQADFFQAEREYGKTLDREKDYSFEVSSIAVEASSHLSHTYGKTDYDSFLK